MRGRIASILALVSIANLAVSIPVHVATAQDQPLRVLKTVGTPDEKPQIDAAVNRLRTKVTGDLAFEKRLDDAIAKRDLSTARSLIATTAQVRPEGVLIGLPAKTAGLHMARDSYFRLASSTLNPWYVLLATKSGAICLGLFATGADECQAAMLKAGYTPAT